MRALDLTDQVFGELTAKKPETIGKRKGWHCDCSCGGKAWVVTAQLRNGNNTTCGGQVHKSAVKVGDRFGKLTVTRVYRDTKNSRHMTECACDCGGTKPNATVRNLQRGATNHCGCEAGKRQPRQPVEVSLTNSLISSYKCNAKNKGRSFELSYEECVSLFNSDCYFCGLAPHREFNRKPYKESIIYSGIDRIDSNVGYVMGNVAPCCTACNYLKGNKNNEEFLAHVHRIAEHQSK